jgi:hypothetical protein
MSSPAPGPLAARPDATRQGWFFDSVQFHLAVLATAFLLVLSRRPDVILNPQFFAEDGAVFYRDAYQFGLHSLFLSYSGYFHTLLRLTALFSRLFPFGWAPLVMNLIAITVQVLPVNVFLSSRFSQISFPVRLLAGFAYLGLPNSFEIHATATNLQWHQALLGCLLLLAEPAKSVGWRVFDGVTLFLTSLSTPMAILLIPIAALVWQNRRETWSGALLTFLLPGGAAQAISVLLHWHARQAPHINFAGQVVFNNGIIGANIHDFAAILGRQVFFSSILGLSTQSLLMSLQGLSFIEFTCAAVGIALLLYALRFGPLELRLFILFSYAVLALGLINPLAGTPDHTQWYWLSRPGCGNRYYFLPMLAFLASLVWVVTRKAKASTVVVRCFASVLLLLLPIGIYRDWRLPPLLDFRFSAFVRKLDIVPPGTRVVIPINPGWLMELTKH